MKKLLITIFILITLPVSGNELLEKTYIIIGAGYKFHESPLHYKDDNGNTYEWDDPYSARLEIGYKYTKNFKFGISHHSQWLTGFPKDNDINEYSKTEVFVDYTFTLSEVFN